MTKASDNAFPSLLITEGTEPSAPAAGKQRLYIDSTTHKLKATNSSGTERDIESTGTATFKGCRAYHSTTQTVSASATTAMIFDSERYDTSGLHSTSSATGKITVDVTGYWHFGTSLYFPTVTGGREPWIGFKVNGTTYIATQSVTTVASQSNLITLVTDYALTAADYVEVYVFNQEAGTITITPNSNASPEFWCHYLGA